MASQFASNSHNIVIPACPESIPDAPDLFGIAWMTRMGVVTINMGHYRKFPEGEKYE